MFLFANLEGCPDGFDADKAVVDLSPADARQLLKRQDLVIDQKQSDGSLYCHEFLNRLCACVSEHDLRRKLESVEKTVLGTESLLAVLGQEEAINVYPDDPAVSIVVDDLNTLPLDCHTVQVTDTAFIWAALTKYGSHPIKTVPIARSFIERAARRSAKHGSNQGVRKAK